MIEKKTLSQLYKKYYQDSLSRLFRDEWTTKKEETYNRLEERLTRAFKKAVREDNKEELNAFIKMFLYYTGEINIIYLDSLCTVANVGTTKELPKEEQQEALNKINNCTYEELEQEIIKLIGADSYKEILNKYIEAQKKTIKSKDKQLIRNYYTRNIFNTYAPLNAPLESNKKNTNSNHKPSNHKPKEKKRTVVLAKYTVISNELAKSIENKEEFIKVQPIYDNPKINAKTRTERIRVRNSIEVYLTTRKEILFNRVKDKQKITGYEIEYIDKVDTNKEE